MFETFVEFICNSLPVGFLSVPLLNLIVTRSAAHPADWHLYIVCRCRSKGGCFWLSLFVGQLVRDLLDNLQHPEGRKTDGWAI